MLLYLPPCTRGQAEGAPPPAPPGLSHAAAKRVCGKLGPEEVRGELLAAKKLSVLRLALALTLTLTLVLTLALALALALTLP